MGLLPSKGIRVNAVAPGPIWTPLTPSTLSKAHIEQFGQDTALGRPGQPEELVGAYVLLAGRVGVEAMRAANYRVDREVGKETPEQAAAWLADEVGL